MTWIVCKKEEILKGRYGDNYKYFGYIGKRRNKGLHDTPEEVKTGGEGVWFVTEHGGKQIMTKLINEYLEKKKSSIQARCDEILGLEWYPVILWNRKNESVKLKNFKDSEIDNVESKWTWTGVKWDTSIDFRADSYANLEVIKNSKCSVENFYDEGVQLAQNMGGEPAEKAIDWIYMSILRTEVVRMSGVMSGAMKAARNKDQDSLNACFQDAIKVCKKAEVAKEQIKTRFRVSSVHNFM